MIILTISYLLNIIDYLFTLHWVNLYGISIEGNPLGRWMFENNVAWAFKIFAAGGLFAALGYFIKRTPKAIIAAYIPLGVYAAIVIYHIFIAIQLYS